MRAIALSLALLLAGCAHAGHGAQPSSAAPQTIAPKPASKGVYYVVPIAPAGPCQPSGIINTHDPRPPCPAIWAEEPRDPPGWRRVELPTYSMAMPPSFSGGATGDKSMLFDSPELELRLKDDPHAPHPRCTFGKPCYRDYTSVVGGIGTEAAVEDWRAAAPNDPRPWRYFAVQHNVYGPREPVIAVEARCSTREVCGRVDALLKHLRMADAGAPLKKGDRNTPSEPEYASPAAYRAGVHSRHTAPNPRGWQRFSHDAAFSMAVPKGFKAEWNGDGEGGLILSIKTKEMDFTVARSGYSGYAQCAEHVRCVRQRTTIDGLPATAMWEDWSGVDNSYVKGSGFLWNFSAAVALPAGNGPSRSLIVQASVSCHARAICEQARAMMKTIEIY